MGSILPPSGSEYQLAYQFYQDDDGLNGASPLAPVNSSATLPIGTRFRLRIGINRELGSPNRYYLLEYRRNGGTWYAVENSQGVQYALSPNFSDGDLTSQRITVPFPYEAGEGIETQRSSRQYTSIEVASELEYCLIAYGDVGDALEFRLVGLGTPWTGGQSYSGYALDYVYIPLAYLGQETEGGVWYMYEYLTEIGMGREPASGTGRFCPAQVKINALTRMPHAQPEVITWGGFRGVNAPVNALHGKLMPITTTLTVEATPPLLAVLLCSLMGIPTTSGSADPYTHTYPLDGDPRTLTLWQRIHHKSTEAGAPIFSGYGGVIVQSLSLNVASEGGGVLTADVGLSALTHLLHNSASAVGMDAAPYYGHRPYTVADLSLTINTSGGASPDWMGEISGVRLTLTRSVFPKWSFSGKHVASGWRYHPHVVLTDLSLDIYREGAKRLKLVLGRPETYSYPVLPDIQVQEYNPTTQVALELKLSYLDGTKERSITISTGRFAWAAATIGAGGEGPDTDTYNLIPLAETSGGVLSTLKEIKAVNDLNATALWSDGTPITGLSGVYYP